MLYKDSVETHHSSAAIRIINKDFNFNENSFLIALQRELATCKKALILAKADFNLIKKNVPSSTFLQTYENLLESITIEISFCNSWQWNRSRLNDLES